MEKRYYRSAEAAKYLGVSKTTIWNYAKAGKLTAKKLSEGVTVFDIKEIEKLFDKVV